MARCLKRLLEPKSIAAIGGREARAVIEQCLALGFSGKIWPVHPSKEEICGLKAYPSIESLPGSPDAAFIGVNRQRTIEIVEALKKRNAGGTICYASGFMEADGDGPELQAALIEAAGDMPVIGPNCYGFLNYASGVALWPDQHGGRKLDNNEPGVAIITQSSNVAINMTMQKRGLPLAYVLTAGNQAQTGLSEIANALLDDPRVTALGLHIEGFDSVAGFEAVAAKARALKKSVVALKVGRSEKARQAAYTHTASMAGSDKAADAFLTRIGIARVHSIPSFLEALKLLHVIGPLDGAAISSMSCSGGEASLMADACMGRKVYFPPLSEAQKQPVREALGEMVTVDNPLDYHTYIWADAEAMTEAFKGMLSTGFDLNCLVLDFPRDDKCKADNWWVAIDALETAADETGARCAVIASLPENITEQQAGELMARNIVPLCGIDEALNAIEVAAAIGQAWAQSQPEPVITTHALTTNAQTFTDEAEAKKTLSSGGVSIPCGHKCTDLDTVGEIAKSIGFPLAIKMSGVAHKSEHNGVHLNISNETQAVEVAASLMKTGKGVYVEAMIGHGVFEVLVGIVRDDQFGLVMTIATGGTLVEIWADGQTLLLPTTAQEIEQALRKLKGAVFFDGFRRRERADLSAAVLQIEAIEKFAIAHAANLNELEINPLIVCAEGQGAVAADALLAFGRENNE